MPNRIKPGRTELAFSRALTLGALLVAGAVGAPGSDPAPPDPPRPSRVFTITEYGAVGDGATLDTPAINQAIAACARAGGGKVLVPPGRYLTGTVRLETRVTLFLDSSATLIGTTNLSHYQQPRPPDFMPEARWGKWHRGLILAENVEDAAIAGPGTIDGNRVFDPTGEERMRGPHTIVFVNCRRFTLRDLNIVDSANYAVFFMVSDQVEVRDVRFTGGWDGVHFRGAPGRDCHDVNIVGCQFYTGDDAIAGRYWDRVLISDCVINSSCNGLRLIGPATRLIVHDCLFYGPGLEPHRTSRELRRTNMLSGIILEPGAWDETRGLLDDVLIADVTMHNVASPVTLWTKPENPVGRVTVSGLNATGVYRAAMSAESWADAPITNLVVRNSSIEFDGGGRAEQATQSVRSPGVDARPLPAWGFYARNIERVVLEDVRLSLAQDDLRPVVQADQVRQLTLDGLRFTPVEGVANPIVLTNIGRLVRGNDSAPERQ